MGQNFNRYSYCLNNPLLYSDPSGNSWLSDAFKWIKKYTWDTPWSWLNGTDKGHPNVYSGGLSDKLAKWGVPSFSVGYNSSKGFLYKVGNNSVVYPAMEVALQKQYAALSAQTQAMVAGERQQREASQAWYYNIPFIGDFMRAGRDHARGNYLSMVNNMCWGALWFVPELGGAGTAARGVEAAESGTTAFRAVSQGELEDIAAFGLRNKAGAYETGKLFAPTLEEAAQFGRNNYLFDGLPNTIMKVNVPNSVMQNVYKFGADGMNAISIPAEYLQFLKATPLNFSPLP